MTAWIVSSASIPDGAIGLPLFPPGFSFGSAPRCPTTTPHITRDHGYFWSTCHELKKRLQKIPHVVRAPGMRRAEARAPLYYHAWCCAISISAMVAIRPPTLYKLWCVSIRYPLMWVVARLVSILVPPAHTPGPGWLTRFVLAAFVHGPQTLARLTLRQAPLPRNTAR